MSAIRAGDWVRVRSGRLRGFQGEVMRARAELPYYSTAFVSDGDEAHWIATDRLERMPRCPDCGEPGESAGHMGCQYPGGPR